MKRRNAFATLIICMLFIWLFEFITNIPIIAITFKETYALLESGFEPESMFDTEAVMNEIIPKINDFILNYQNEIMIFATATFLLIIIMIYKFNVEKLQGDLRLHSFPPKHIPIIIITGAALTLFSIYITNFLSMIFPSFLESGEEVETIAEAANSSPWLAALYSVILAPVTEEVLCRGIIVSKLKNSFQPKTVILLSGLFFAILHGNIYQFSYTLPLGALFCYLTYAYDSIIPAIIIHSAYNASFYLFRIPEYCGFAEGSAEFSYINFCVMFFFIALIPISILLFKKYVPRPDLSPIGFIPEFPDRKLGEDFPDMEDSEFMAIDYIVAGLGNPGSKYVQNRHNIGFLALDYIGLRENFGTPRQKFHALCCEKDICGKRVLFMKPQTMMNLSGEAVGEAQRFYKLPPENVLIIFDDINFDAGEIRIRKNGSAGGHNGIKNIISHLGSDNFPRIKVGVGKLPPESDLINWVLSDPPEDDMSKIVSEFESVYDAAKLIIGGDCEKAQAKYN